MKRGKQHVRWITAFNILGLSLALATFTIIMMVQYFERNYDKTYPNAERIYDVSMFASNNFFSSKLSCKPSDIKLLSGADELYPEKELKCPFSEVEDVCIMRDKGYGREHYSALDNPEVDTLLTIQVATPSVFQFFGLKIKAGSTEKFAQDGTVVITEWLAKFLFPNETAVGKRILQQPTNNWNNYYVSLPKHNDTLTVIAVYEDLPQNASLSQYGLIRCYQPEETMDYIYLKLKNSIDKKQLEEKMYVQYQERYHAFWDHIDTTGDEDLDDEEYFLKYHDAPSDCDSIVLTNLHDNFKAQGFPWTKEDSSADKSSKMIFAFGIVILLVAFLNFSNFAVAAVPFKLRETNIKKVLGRTNGQLRATLFGELIALVAIAYLIALGIVQLCAITDFIPFIDISLKLQDNIPVLGWITLTVFIIALLSSLYPMFYSTSASRMRTALQNSLSAPHKHSRWRNLLRWLNTTPATVVQFYCAFAVVTFLLLVWVQNHEMKTEDVGFTTENIYVTHYRFLGKLSTDPDTITVGQNRAPSIQKIQQLEKALTSISGVNELTWAVNPVMGIGNVFMGRGLHVGDSVIPFECRAIAENFFDFFNIKMKSGKVYDEQIANQNAENSKTRATVYGDTFCFVLNESALKEHPCLQSADVRAKAGVSGVVCDFHNQPLQEEIFSVLYKIDTADVEFGSVYIYVKLENDNLQELLPKMEKAIEAAGFHWELFEPFTSLSDDINKEYEKEDEFAKLVLLFSAVILVVTLVGVLGLVMLDGHYRRKELSLRRVYGATSGKILWKLMRRYLLTCVVCFALAAPLALELFKKWQGNFAFKCDIPVWVFIATFAGITLLTVFLVLLQSLRVLRTNPAEVLHCE